ncbi:methyltransferase domain-containing protein [Streptomyces sp. AV19]|uniref:class I SAM-dependent methyltransferase n=1 Tax=Streptomyces sp. AV19 TaxID=2793068 RepID=UPI0018FE48DA|nr:class I SAM-dependent methyltransferase [Streptomyces sp. AV19]MBH1937796.1 methyltransferase domain-containing protein [Streptomyces sp. AV19]MDG4537072.1 class I SAM-dependent methyltransferase [Streptomyces sp. AV19]
MILGQHIGYVDLVSLVGETNRCPGGKRAISRLAQTLHVGPHHRVLEVGSNTGFTSIELAAIIGCRTDGVEINAAAVEEARRSAAALPARIAERVSFHVGDVRKLPWAEETFDVVVCGGALGFVEDRESAFSEIWRVLRPLGMVSITHLYYRSTPSASLLDRLADVLGFRVPAYGWEEWLEELAPAGWELYDFTLRPLAARPTDVVDAYAEHLTSSARIEALPPEQRDRVREQWRHACHVFNDNHRYLGAMDVVLRRPLAAEAPEQPELFLEPGVYDRHFTHEFVPLAGTENR